MKGLLDKRRCALDKCFLGINVLLLITFFTCFAKSACGQQEIAWNFIYNAKQSQLELEAKLADGWHLYSQHISSDIGPVPTTFSFKESSGLQLLGETIEPEPIKRFDQAFEAELTFFEKQVVFIQKIKQTSVKIVKGTVSFMLCNDEMCLPPEEKEFEITIN